MGLGHAITRHEDDILLRGQGRFAGDVAVDGALWMHVVRSDHAAGLLRGIDAEGARVMPGVRLILTGADQAAAGLSSFALRYLPAGAQVTPTPFLPLAVDAVRWVGEPVAVVVADTAMQAQDAAEALIVDIDDGSAVTDARAAALPDAPKVWAERDSNRIFEHHLGDAEAFEAAAAKATNRIDARIEISRVTATALEPRNALALPDAQGCLTLHTGTQAPHRVRAELSLVLGLKPDQLRVSATHTGGSFGMRNGAYPEDALVLWAARITGQPVRWQATRSDSFVADAQSRQQSVDVSLLLDANHRFLGLRVDGYAPVGAHIGPMSMHPMTANLPGLAGVYTTQALHVVMRGMHVNSVYMAPY